MAAPRELDLAVTLGVAWKAWEEHLYARVDADTFSPESARNYLAYARRLVDHLGPDRSCDSIESGEIGQWLAHYRAAGARRPTFQQKGASPATLRHCHKSAKGLFEFAGAQRWLRESPMRDIPAPQLPPRRTGTERAALSRGELDAVLAAARAGRGSFNGDRGCWVRDEIVIRLAGESGLRNGDICNLDLGDIEADPAGHWVAQIRRGKGRKARTVPLTDACAALIRDYVEQWRPVPYGLPDRYDQHHKLTKGDAQALLLSAERHHFNSASIRHIVDRCAKSALGRHYVPHGLRHTTGTLLVREARADIAVVAHIMGHSDISVTSVYLDTRGDEAAAAVNRRKVGARAKAPQLPPGSNEPRWPECGTREGWNRHRREKGPKCMPCLVWKREDAERADMRALTRQLADRERVIASQGETIQRLREALARKTLGVTPGRRPRALCPVCEESISVTCAGVMRKHRCDGSGLAPEVAVVLAGFGAEI